MKDCNTLCGVQEGGACLHHLFCCQVAHIHTHTPCHNGRQVACSTRGQARKGCCGHAVQEACTSRGEQALPRRHKVACSCSEAITGARNQPHHRHTATQETGVLLAHQGPSCCSVPCVCLVHNHTRPYHTTGSLGRLIELHGRSSCLLGPCRHVLRENAHSSLQHTRRRVQQVCAAFICRGRVPNL